MNAFLISAASPFLVHPGTSLESPSPLTAPVSSRFPQIHND
jgi:hypothetical protein